MNSILYISTNKVWSGSEELWTRSAKQMSGAGVAISFVTKYNHSHLKSLNGPHLDISQQATTIVSKAIQKLYRLSGRSKNKLDHFISSCKPALIIVSQGNNVDSLEVLETCAQSNIPYLTITQLVTELHLLYINNENLHRYQAVYQNAGKNFFVSAKNLQLNNEMLGLELGNAEVVYNPCKLSGETVPKYPSIENGYRIALVGRIECFHKGYDLVLEVISAGHWQKRNVQFTLYGSGPHTELIKQNCRRLNIKNLELKGYSEDITAVWKQNHLLCMPSRMEGQALSLIEAMWCHRAAVVTDVGGATELVEEGVSGFIAKSATVDEIDRALERAWSRREEWKTIGENAGAALRSKYPADAVGYFNERVKELF